MSAALSKRLLKWFAHHQRDLPWRRSRDPYRIWIAEIMLQQTQVKTVTPYYQRWLKRFPTLRALAEASQRDVLSLWEGLGYYSRARNLHRGAQQVMGVFGGRLPRTVDELRTLPGIGPYTAGAIASIAFGADAAVLDGNVKRVLARVFNHAEDIKSPRTEKALWALAESLVPTGHAGEHNQALMDLGATICTPRNPACLLCPLRGLCEAQRLGLQHERPVTAKRRRTPHHTLALAVLRKRGRVLIMQRASTELLGGLWQFPAVRVENGDAQAQALQRGLRLTLGVRAVIGAPVQIIKHAYTHFSVSAHVFECEWKTGTATAGKWVLPSGLADYPMGKVDRRVAQRLCR
jgi:A/G-specific adenine glycosylase